MLSMNRLLSKSKKTYFQFSLKEGHFLPLFLYFGLFNTVDSRFTNVLYKMLPMTGFEPWTSCNESDHSAN